MDLPVELHYLVEDALIAVQTNPSGQLSQEHRHRIFDVMWTERTDACKWTAILTARYVQSLYEKKWESLISNPARNDDKATPFDMRLIIRSVANGYLGVLENLYYMHPSKQRDYAKRMITIAEDVMLNLLVPQYAEAVTSGFYFEIMTQKIRTEPQDAYFALWAAYQTLCTVAGTKPLESQVGKHYTNPDGSEGTLWSQQWDDEALVQDGGYAADFAVYAAFAHAFNPKTMQCDSDKMQAFWIWWLAEVIPQGWDKAEET